MTAANVNVSSDVLTQSKTGFGTAETASSKPVSRTPALPLKGLFDRPLELAVIIPTLNESGNVAALISDLDRVLEGRAWEAVFVDDGSTDGTPDLIAGLGQNRHDVRLIRRVGRRGLSSAVVEGMLATTAPIVAVIDADRQHDEGVLPTLYRAVADEGADLAVATRYTAGGSADGLKGSRARISAFATAFAQRLTGITVTDPMSGFFVIRHATLVKIAPRLSTIGFKILLDILLSSPRELRIAEVPYRFRSRVAGTSKLSATVAFDYGLLLLEKLTHGLVSARLAMFLMVGGLGLVVNLLLLRVFLAIDGGWFEGAQALAVVLTIALNFTINNRLTYRDRRLYGVAFWKGLSSFYLVCGLGAAANVWLSNLVFAVHPNWWIAGTIGAVMSAIWNYTASSFFTWRNA